MSEQQHPFIPGAAVIVQSQCSHYGPGTFRRDEVAKLHKNGQFTLKSDPQARFRPYQSGFSDGDREWIGSGSSQGYSIYSTHVRIVTAESEKEMVDGIESHAHKARCRALEKAFANPNKIPAVLSKTISDMLASN